MNIRRLQPSSIAAAAGITLAMGAGVAALLPEAPAASVLAFGAAAASAAAIGLRRRASERSAVIEDLIGAATSNAETGRRLAIFERDTQLFAHWYVELRGHEETDRAGRYNRDLTMVVIEPTPGPDERPVQLQVAEWLRAHKRNTDIVGYLGNARYIVIMPETALLPTKGFAERLFRDIVNIDLGIASFPDDGVTYEKMYAAAVARLGSESDAGDAEHVA